MSAWSVLLTLGSTLILGHRVDRFLMRAWKGRAPLRYPVDGPAWAAVAFPVAVMVIRA